ncbi:GNAT family N-acetyltransferase [Phenylobacterium sp.]|uniref:GNAT family N-acetyltransferase n=1 Tax=Phenylobacterium sp. TaxID=1871053 RepID=UPI00286BF4BD|nr:GNAT family N-acetyltransferase [Phenylobacterium sp.]
MSTDILVETGRASALSAEARDLWRGFRDADPALSSPYFDLRYTLAAGGHAPGVEVATISRRAEIIGFLPFQRRGALIQPIAAPLTDYHGVVAAPGADIDLKTVVAALGARRFSFSGLVGAPPVQSDTTALSAMVADLSQGVDAYLARRPSAVLKDKRRRARRLAEDHGALEFSLTADVDEALALVFRLKRRQMRRTGQHDVLAGPWTRGFLRRLAASSDPDFGLRLATLRAGGTIVAAEVGLRSGDVYHLWLPVYEPAYARYSPGALMTLETVRAAAAQGVRLVDFGPARETYKGDFADPGQPVHEGDLTVGGFVESARNTTRRALAGAPTILEALDAASRRLDRRWDRITACEPRIEGRMGAASLSLADIARRRPKTSIGLGLGLGLGVAGLLAD